MDQQINEIIVYMNNHKNKGVKIEKIAYEFGYSKFHFSREFKKLTGITPTEYMSGLRMSQAIDSLIQGNSVTDSHLDAGYTSSSTFSTRFSNNTGLSPQTYYKKINNLFEIAKEQEITDEDSDSLFYRNPLIPAQIAPFKLTIYIDVPENFKGLVFCGLFLKPNPNHQPAMGRCRVKQYKYDFYHLPQGVYYPLACGIQKNMNPFNYFQLSKAMRACDGQKIKFPLEKNEVLHITLREKKVSDPPLLINLPQILATGIKQQIQRNKKNLKKKLNPAK